MEGKRIPKIGELVMANVSKIMPFGAYCKLPEYDNLDVYLPIKEVSSGWIKNIHEFIHEGQTIVCKVIFYDENRQTIDVSVKKVTPTESKQKLDSYNLEKRLVGLFARAINVAGLQDEKKEYFNNKIIEAFGNYTNFMRNANIKTKEFNNLKLPKNLKDALEEVLKSTHQKRNYNVSYIMTLSLNNTTNGADLLRNIFSRAEKYGVSIKYISAPKYYMTAKGPSYTDAEKKIKAAIESIKHDNSNGIFEIEKEKLKKEKKDILTTL
ncbi:MAG: S1 RNA-binding domain-containing protein [Candidatus Marsarchaeota archaeon]|nr:S1 RNA-binding domain-containing protein [Candidatus Marsarchaeota archaeon]